MATGTVLIVDHDSFLVQFMVLALKDQGYTVLTAADEEALAVARMAQPDVILLDLGPPTLDGVEVSRLLRDDPETARIPIVAISAPERLRSAAAQMPVNALLPKPFHFGDLYAEVARWVHVPQSSLA